MGDSPSAEKPAAQAHTSAQWEIDFYEDILKRNPDYVEVLMILGSLYTGTKMYTKGLLVDQRLASLKKDDPVVHYNLACSYSLLKQPDLAFAALSKAIDLGYADAEHMNADSDLNAVRTDPRYAEALARMQGRGR